MTIEQQTPVQPAPAPRVGGEGIRLMSDEPPHSAAGDPQDRRVIPLRQGEAHATRVIAVTSGKGGVGKTLIAANLGLCLARQGRRVLLIDADLALANLDLMLGVTARHTIREVLTQHCRIEEALVRTPEGVCLLPACSGDEDMERLDDEKRMVLFGVIDSLEDEFDTLIVDTGAGIGSNAVRFASAAAQVLVVVTPDPASMADAYAMIKVLARRGIKRINLVVNMASNAQEAERVVGQLLTLVGQFLDIAVIPVGCLYRDETALRSVRSCRPLVRDFPKAAVSHAIASLARRLLEEPGEEVSSGPMLFWKRIMGIAGSSGDQETGA